MFQKKVCGTSPNHSRLDCANLTYYNSLTHSLHGAELFLRDQPVLS